MVEIGGNGSSDPTQADVAVEAALHAIQLPPGNGRIYVGCEICVTVDAALD